MAIIGVAKEGLNSASEAGTKYRAFLIGAGKAQNDLGLSFVDSAGNMLPMVEILNRIKGKYGDTISVAEKLELDKAFGSQEATGLVMSLINKTDKLTSSQLELQKSMNGGTSKAEQMAKAMDRGYGYTKIGHSVEYLGYTFGKILEPAVNLVATGFAAFATSIAWIDTQFPIVTELVVGLGAGVVALKVAVVAVKTAKLAWQFVTLSTSKSLLGMTTKLGVLNISMLASSVKTKAVTAAQALWSVGTKAAAASQWILNAALSANPIGVVIAGVGALAAGAVYLYKNFEPFTKLIDAVWAKIKGFFSFYLRQRRHG